MNHKTFTKLLKVLGVLLLVSIVCNLTSLHGEVPKLINFEGKLTDSEGNAISGLKSITFRIYDSDTAATSIWSETRDVTLDKGFYNVLLGSAEPFSPSMKFDTTYWLGVQLSGDSEMAPRYQIGAVPYAINADMVDGKNSNEVIPRGLIAMWSGMISEIPAGWHLCDGTDETPDLSNRFILGVSAGENPRGTGGSHSITLITAQLPAHNHGSAGTHTHMFRVDGISPPWGQKGVKSIRTVNLVAPFDDYGTGSSGAHTHLTVGSGAPIDNRPAYYKLAYIMKL